VRAHRGRTNWLQRALLVLLIVIGLPAARVIAASADGAIDREFRECSDCPTMVAVPAGSFMMGSPATEPGRFDAEGPQHRVTVHAFAIGKFDVTTAEFLDFLSETGYQPAPCDEAHGLGWQSPGRGRAYPPTPTDPPLWPAVCLSWNDAEAYIAWLNNKVRALPSAPKTGEGPYRLPSEAEWEYAARAGTIAARWWGDAVGVAKANCNGCGSQWDDHELAPVGSFGPNPFGLFDMLGNVWQWVGDCWNDSYVGAPVDGGRWFQGDCRKRVLRGGSWSNLPTFVRSAVRSRGDADGKSFDYATYAGFRVVRALP
jgi:formylglycine-generating enzyme required for sulfatase activity